MAEPAADATLHMVVLGRQGSARGPRRPPCGYLRASPRLDGRRFPCRRRRRLRARAYPQGVHGQGRAGPRRRCRGRDQGAPLRPGSPRGFILDGFPRTVAQAEALAEMAAPRGIDVVIDLEADNEEVLQRMAGRRVCTKCGATYNLVDKPPKVPGFLRAEAHWHSATTTPRTPSAGGSKSTRPLPPPSSTGTGSAACWWRSTPSAMSTRSRPGWVAGVEEAPQGQGCRPERAPRPGQGHGYPGGMRRRPDEIAKMRKAGRVVAEMLEVTAGGVQAGVTTAQLDKLAREVLERRGARSNFLGYHGFPAVICTSPNSVIVHGIPGPYVVQEGDIISLDCGAIIEGYRGTRRSRSRWGRSRPGSRSSCGSPKKRCRQD